MTRLNTQKKGKQIDTISTMQRLVNMLALIYERNVTISITSARVSHQSPTTKWQRRVSATKLTLRVFSRAK